MARGTYFLICCVVLGAFRVWSWSSTSVACRSVGNSVGGDGRTRCWCSKGSREEFTRTRVKTFSWCMGDKCNHDSRCDEYNEHCHHDETCNDKVPVKKKVYPDTREADGGSDGVGARSKESRIVIFVFVLLLLVGCVVLVCLYAYKRFRKYERNTRQGNIATNALTSGDQESPLGATVNGSNTSAPCAPSGEGQVNSEVGFGIDCVTQLTMDAPPDYTSLYPEGYRFIPPPYQCVVPTGDENDDGLPPYYQYVQSTGDENNANSLDQNH